MLGDKYGEIKKFFGDAYNRGRMIEDDEGIIWISGNRVEIIPKGDITIKEFHIKCFNRLMERGLVEKVNCFISEDGKKVVIER